MTTDTATEFIKRGEYLGYWSPLEEALFTLITDLQRFQVELHNRVVCLEKDLNE